MGCVSPSRDVVSLSLAGALGRVLRRQHLVPCPAGSDLVEVAGDLAGLHATRPTTPPLSLLARLPGFRRKAFEHALCEERSLVRLKSMRQTVFVVPRACAALVLAATRRPLETSCRRYLASNGVCAEACERLAPRITEALRGRELTVAELRATAGGGSDVAAVVGLLCDRGVLVRTRPARGWRDAANRYALMAEWLPEVDAEAIPEQEAVAWLVRAYLVGYGPVSERDVAWWTGLPMKSVRGAFAILGPELVNARVDGLEGPLPMLRASVPACGDAELAAGTALTFLPVLDPYVMGYKERTRYLDPGIADRVFDRGGNGTATIVLDGRVVGVWDIAERPFHAVHVHLFTAMDDALLARVHSEAHRVGRFFFGTEATVQHVSAMQPLTGRPTGAYAPFRGNRAP
ncbi:MAG: AlkZ family DNA glycosylase [Deltaproteobacteria bacterium]|nr:AlkZ family DNA glycosylase [Deltaproteobacteria bacterium]